MEQVTPSIEIGRRGTVLKSLKVIMPIWNRTGDDKNIYTHIPLFGLETHSSNSKDEQIAIEEAIKCFCIVAEKFGKGLEAELEAIGWALEKTPIKNRTLLNIHSRKPMLRSIINTGSNRAVAVSI